jgi:hypothetical protein
VVGIATSITKFADRRRKGLPLAHFVAQPGLSCGRCGQPKSWTGGVVTFRLCRLTLVHVGHFFAPAAKAMVEVATWRLLSLKVEQAVALGSPPPLPSDLDEALAGTPGPPS